MVRGDILKIKKFEDDTQKKIGVAIERNRKEISHKKSALETQQQVRLEKETRLLSEKNERLKKKIDALARGIQEEGQKDLVLLRKRVKKNNSEAVSEVFNIMLSEIEED